MTQQTQRLDKYLANIGVASRRDIKQLLKKEKVEINGQRVTESGTRILPSDTVTINDQPLKKQKQEYYLLNKPPGIISTSSDELGRENVVDLVETTSRVYPVGRLDKDTHGLIILTNDGELTHKVTHPRYHTPKTYELTISGKAHPKQLKAFETGILLKDGVTQPAHTKIIRETKDKTLVEVTLHEGRNRQIRRMCETVGMELLDLKRVSFGPINLGKLPLGKYRELTTTEINALKKAVALKTSTR